MCFTFSLAGYRSAITIRNISEKDFNYLEEFSESIPNMIINFLKTHSITSKKVDLDQISKCFMRLNFIDEKATFLQDDKNLVLHVVSYVNQKLGSGKDFYKSLSLFTKKSVFVRSTRSLVKTKVGLLFCPKPNNEQLLPTQAAPASSTNTRSFNASLKGIFQFYIHLKATTQTNFLIIQKPVGPNVSMLHLNWITLSKILKTCH